MVLPASGYPTLAIVDDVMDAYSLSAIDGDGGVIPVAVLIETVGRQAEARLRMKIADGEYWDFTADDFFKCLMNARLKLEAVGLLLCCQGARPDVFVSGMQQQMALGRVGYVMVEKGEVPQEVDIFASADPSEVVSVEEQRVAIYRHFNLPMPE
jgi:hypothetical protein